MQHDAPPPVGDPTPVEDLPEVVHIPRDLPETRPAELDSIEKMPRSGLRVIFMILTRTWTRSWS